MRTFKVLLFLLLATASHASNFSTENIEGWTVHINKLAKPQIKNKARAFLTKDLQIIKAKVPNNTLLLLQKMSFTLGRGSNAHWASYSYVRESVEFKTVDGFVNGRGFYPDVVLHELAHGYHELKIGVDYRSKDGKRLTQAWENYKKRYKTMGKSVLVPKANPSNDFFLKWAAINQLEYFAEMSTAYFGVHRYWSKMRDKEAERMIAEFWGINAKAVSPNNTPTFTPNMTRRNMRIILRIKNRK